MLIEFAVDLDVRAIRLPRSSRWTPTALCVRSLSAALSVRAGRAGLAFPEASTGLDQDAPLDGAHLLTAIERLVGSGARSAELITHLGRDPDPDRERYVTRCRWAEELAAICDPHVGSAGERSGVRLGSFADLALCRSDDRRVGERVDPAAG